MTYKSKNKKMADLTIPICHWHKPHGLDYMAWTDWAFKLHSRGIHQKQCPVCTRWLFPEEMGVDPDRFEHEAQNDPTGTGKGYF